MNIRQVTLFIQDDLSSADTTLKISWRVGEGIRTSEFDVSLDADGISVVLTPHTSNVGSVAFPGVLKTWKELDNRK